MNLTILMTRLPYAVFLSVLLFASHAQKPDNKSDPASNENDEEAVCGKLLVLKHAVVLHNFIFAL